MNTMGAVMLIVSMFYLLLTICILYVSCKYVLPILIMYHTVKGVKEKEKRFVIFVNFSNYLARIPGSNDHL